MRQPHRRKTGEWGWLGFWMRVWMVGLVAMSPGEALAQGEALTKSQALTQAQSQSHAQAQSQAQGRARSQSLSQAQALGQTQARFHAQAITEARATHGTWRANSSRSAQYAHHEHTAGRASRRDRRGEMGVSAPDRSYPFFDYPKTPKDRKLTSEFGRLPEYVSMRRPVKVPPPPLSAGPELASSPAQAINLDQGPVPYSGLNADDMAIAPIKGGSSH